MSQRKRELNNRESILDRINEEEGRRAPAEAQIEFEEDHEEFLEMLDLRTDHVSMPDSSGISNRPDLARLRRDQYESRGMYDQTFHDEEMYRLW